MTMAVGLAFILAKEGSPPTVAAIEQEIKANWPDFPATQEFEQQDGTISFNMDGAPVFFAYVDAPFPWSDLEGPCATSMLWPNAAEEIQAHRGHWIVTVMGDHEPIEMATLLTQATAVLLSVLPSAIGVYWGNATLIIPKPMFIDFTKQVLPDEAPLFLWVDFRVGSDTPSGTSGFTTGMEALGHMELEVHNGPETVPETRERLMDLVGYLLANGPVIEDGNTVGNSAEERILVRYGDSKFGYENKVMRLVYDDEPTPKKPKSKWQFWRN